MKGGEELVIAGDIVFDHHKMAAGNGLEVPQEKDYKLVLAQKVRDTPA